MDTRTGTALFVGLVVGALLGAAGVHLLTREEVPPEDAAVRLERSVEAEAADRAYAHAPEPVLSGRAGDDVEAEPSAEPRPAPGDLRLARGAFADAYRAAFRARAGNDPTAEQLDAAWARLQETTAAAAAGMAGAAAHAALADRRQAEITARDDIMALLEDRERREDAQALRNDPEAFARLLGHKGVGPALSGPDVASRPAGPPLPDGAQLIFPAGVYAVGERALLGEGRAERMPRDLTLRGAGIDATLVRLSDFSARDLVYNLHLADCTIDCGNDGAFDLRSEKASVYAENVRFVRFDAGHGGCTLFSFSRGGAVYCRDCRFEGGYGSSPGSGRILQAVEVARFEDCVFERILYDVAAHNPAFFARCTFRDCAHVEATRAQSLAYPVPRGARFDGCRFESTLRTDGLLTSASLGRDLKTLFPAVGDDG